MQISLTVHLLIKKKLNTSGSKKLFNISYHRRHFAASPYLFFPFSSQNATFSNVQPCVSVNYRRLSVIYGNVRKYAHVTYETQKRTNSFNAVSYYKHGPISLNTQLYSTSPLNRCRYPRNAVGTRIMDVFFLFLFFFCFVFIKTELCEIVSSG